MNEKEKEKLRGLFDAIESEDPNEVSVEYAQLKSIHDRYERKALLGEGGMKKVWKVYDRRSRAMLAYAEPREGLHPVYYDTMLEEAWRTAALSHPNIIKIHDVGADEHPYFTMDLKHGDSMKDWVVNKAPSLNDRLDAFLNVCEAMIHAHSHHVLHLDLKPDNIQIEGQNEAIVCDWGSGGQQSGATLGFMAPEQCDSESTQDEQTDIYGLGALLYFLLTSASPIEGETTAEVITKTKSGIQDPRTRFPSLKIPSALNQIIARAMKVQPKERYAAIKLLTDDLRNYRQLRPTSMQLKQPMVCSWLFYQRHQLVTNFMIVGSLILVIGVGWGIRKVRLFQMEQQLNQAKTEKAMQQTKSAKEELQTVQNSVDELTKIQEDVKLGIIDQLVNASGGLKDKSIYKLPMQTVHTLERMANLAFLHVPNSEQAWSEMLEIHFLNLNFSEIFKIINAKKESVPDKWSIYSGLPNQSYQTGQESLYRTVVSHFDDPSVLSTQKLVMRFLCYARAKKELSYQEALAIYLKWADSNLGEYVFSYDSNELKLGVRTSKKISHDLLQIFNCKKITLTGNWPSKLYYFRQSGVQELDISQSHALLKGLNTFSYFEQLQTITVKKGMLSEEEWQEIPSRIKVIQIHAP